MSVRLISALLVSAAMFASPVSAQDDLSLDSMRDILVPKKTRAIGIVPVSREEKTLYEDLEKKVADPTAIVEDYEREEIYAAVKEYEMPALDLDIYFDTGSSAITPRAAVLLDKLVDVLANLKDGEFLINGHTDARGSAYYNQTLSEQRAFSVRQYLLDHGVTSIKLVALGFGEEQLKDPRNPGDGVNRRVEIVNYVSTKKK